MVKVNLTYFFLCVVRLYSQTVLPSFASFEYYTEKMGSDRNTLPIFVNLDKENNIYLYQLPLPPPPPAHCLPCSPCGAP